MTDDKLEAMAREAHADTGKDYDCHRLWLARFAELVRADERERCAKLCERARPFGRRAWDEAQAACFDALSDTAAAIRARTP